MLNLMLGQLDAGFKLTDIAKHWHTPMMSVKWFFICAGAFTLLVVVCRGYKIWRHSKLHPGPIQIFRSLARQIGLSSQEQKLLLNIARDQKLTSPLTLMISQGTLQHHVNQYGQAFTQNQKRHLVGRLKTISSALFD